MKKVFLFFASALFATNLFGQLSINVTECSTELARPYVPAPCSIAGHSTRVELHMIQVGAYTNQIVPRPGCIVLESSLYDQTIGQSYNIYRYYIAGFFVSKQEAEKFMVDKKIKDVFCDAIVVPMPIQNMYGFF